MANGEWFKNISILKKAKLKVSKKTSTCKKSNGGMPTSSSGKVPSKSKNNFIARIRGMDKTQIENTAATHIQSSFRAYKAMKDFRCIRGTARLQTLIQGYSAKTQASAALSYLHSWNRIQAEITAHRMSMAAEGRIKQKKLNNQIMLEAKLYDQEVEFDAGAETMEEIFSKIRRKEEAAVKRERALAYAFSHQWRPTYNFGLVNPDYGNENWGWSWMDRWIAARPWESRVPVRASPKKGHSQQDGRVGKKLTTQTTNTNAKTISPNGKVSSKARKLTYDTPQKLNPRKSADKIKSVDCNRDITTF